MDIPSVILAVMLIVLSVATIFLILSQKKKTSAMGGISGMGAQPTYADRNKGRTFEATLERYTKFGAVIIVALTVATWLM
ncbi:hypothetical protein FACS1894188_08600 [Clostridia bacterium]|nr:hypothetical protein FACS1894188_08600 [Clostridia bacterium]